MKTITLIFLLFSSSICFSQSYDLVKKAEKKIIEKDYTKALKLLNRALLADYGFCGTAKIEAEIEINRLRLKLFNESNNENEMAKFLDNIDVFLEFENIYTIERIKLALKKYSKEELNIKIIESFKKSDKNIWVDFSNLVYLKFEDSYSLKMLLNSTEIWKIKEENKIEYNEALIQYYLNSEYKKLLN